MPSWMSLFRKPLFRGLQMPQEQLLTVLSKGAQLHANFTVLGGLRLNLMDKITSLTTLDRIQQFRGKQALLYDTSICTAWLTPQLLLIWHFVLEWCRANLEPCSSIFECFQEVTNENDVATRMQQAWNEELCMDNNDTQITVGSRVQLFMDLLAHRSESAQALAKEASRFRKLWPRRTLLAWEYNEILYLKMSPQRLRIPIDAKAGSWPEMFEGFSEHIVVSGANFGMIIQSRTCARSHLCKGCADVPRNRHCLVAKTIDLKSSGMIEQLYKKSGPKPPDPFKPCSSVCIRGNFQVRCCTLLL